jgi:hypothetical protein
MVHSWDDPEEVPVIRADGSVVLLLNDGSIKILTEAK